ncbi:hypothetical protein FBALC1_08923 [Flavobacteriales bacterium ALC-1]|nr:hypothetical protein FBALC1_08923 [Flavobacteriales bacterium ALC-1]
MVHKLIYTRLRLLFCFVIATLLWNCKSSDINNTNSTEIASLEALMNNSAYYIDIEVAFPFTTGATTQVLNALLLRNTGNNAGRIDVRGDDNFITITTDSVSGNLSFFGERRLSGGRYSGSDGSIHFEGFPEDFKKTVNKSKRKLEIDFKTQQKEQSSEGLDVNIEVFPNKKVVVKVTSTFRTFMHYSGVLKPIKPEFK